MKTLKKFAGWLCIATVLGLGVAMIAYPAAVNQVAGLAIAQSATQWNQLKDMAQGDAQATGAGLFSPCLWNGLTCDRQRGSIANGAQVDVTRLGGASTPTDAFANPTTTNNLWVLNSIFNGTTWDRVRSATADALPSTGITAAGLVGWNGGSWDRLHAVSAGNNTATTINGALQVTQASTWSVTNTPAVATQATASKAAGGGTVRHVAASITVCVAANGTAQTPLLFHLRDGATGAGTILRSWAFSAPVTSSQCASITGLNITGSANTAMTIESAAAPVAAAQATVSLSGYSTP